MDDNGFGNNNVLLLKIVEQQRMIENFAVVIENETGLLSDDALTPEKLEEILITLRHRREYAEEIIDYKDAEIKHNDAEIERLRAALEFYAKDDNWGDGEVCSVIDNDTGDIAREALQLGATWTCPRCGLVCSEPYCLCNYDGGTP